MPGAGDGEVWTIVVAAGTGRRFGGAKQFAVLDRLRVVDHSVATAATVSDGVVLVAPDDPQVAGATVVVGGGATRSASVRCGLAAVPEAAGVVVVHDAARPLASAALFERSIAAVRAGAAAGVPAIPVTDSLRRVVGGPIERDELVAVQTPQAFRADLLRAAHASAPEASDDASVVEALGHAVVLVEGDRWNLKITERADLVVAAALMEARR